MEGHGLVARALTADWRRWRRKLPPHLRLSLPLEPPGGELGATLARIALRQRRAWIADGRPDVLPSSARRVEREWGALARAHGAADGPEKPSRDRVHGNTTVMLEASPSTPKRLPVGLQPEQFVSGWYLALSRQEIDGWKVPALSTIVDTVRRSSGGHGERHQRDFERFDSAWLLRKLTDLAGRDDEQRALLAITGLAWSLGGANPTTRSNAVLIARDYLAQLGLPGSELAIWLRGRLTGAAKSGGGRRTIEATIELVLDRARRRELANMVMESGERLLASRIRGWRPLLFSIGYDEQRGFYYHFNVIGACIGTEGRRTSGVDVFWSDQK